MAELLSVELQPIQVNLNGLGNCCIPFKNEAPHLLFCNTYENSIRNIVVVDTRSGDTIFRSKMLNFLPIIIIIQIFLTLKLDNTL